MELLFVAQTSKNLSFNYYGINNIMEKKYFIITFSKTTFGKQNAGLLLGHPLLQIQSLLMTFWRTRIAQVFFQKMILRG